MTSNYDQGIMCSITRDDDIPAPGWSLQRTIWCGIFVNSPFIRAKRWSDKRDNIEIMGSKIWSKVNKEKAEALITSGRMKSSGYKAIEVAKQNGQWAKAYESQSKFTLPEDFASELDKNSQAKEFYDMLDSQNKFAIVFRINNAKKQETREKRIEQFISMLERHEKIYP